VTYAVLGHFTNATFGPFDTLTTELGGTVRGSQYDAVAVTGALALDGGLQLQFINAFAPAAGASFDLLDWGTHTGTFSSLNLPALPTDRAWDTSALCTTGTISVTAVPEPGTLALVGVAAAIGWVRFWRRRWQPTGPSVTLSPCPSAGSSWPPPSPWSPAGKTLSEEMPIGPRALGTLAEPLDGGACLSTLPPTESSAIAKPRGSRGHGLRSVPGHRAGSPRCAG
jgi:hypothetical protein